VLTNLVDNALRYTDGPVRVALDAFDNNLVFRVTDTGSGIDAETLRVVTDPFYRFEDAVEADCAGLHVVRMLVESHGGRGQIDSDARGTTAVFVIPRFPSMGHSNRVLDAISA
jgi:signal transduction histidine kinase